MALEASRLAKLTTGTIHAAAKPFGAYILVCTEKAVGVSVENGTPDRVNCQNCRKAFDNGKAVWRY